MSKKFMAQRSREAAHARKTVAVSTVPTFLSEGPRREERMRRRDDWEQEGLDRVSKFMNMSVPDLELARIEHISAILDMELQIQQPFGHPNSADANWEDRTRTALRHRKVALSVIQNVILLKRGAASSRSEFFLAAAMRMFEQHELVDIWTAAKAIAPEAACWSEGH